MVNKEFENQIIVGRISYEIANDLHIEAGEIILCDGNDMWGRNHINFKHKQDLQNMGYDNTDDFVIEVVTNFNQIRQGSDNSLLLVKWNGLPKVVFIALNFDLQTNCYTVGSAGFFRKTYVEKKKLLWERSAPFR